MGVGWDIYIILNTWWIDPRIEKVDMRYKRGLLRCIISITSPVWLILLFILPSWFDKSIFEIILVLGFMPWFLTLIGSFSGTRFKIIAESSDDLESEGVTIN